MDKTGLLKCLDRCCGSLAVRFFSRPLPHDAAAIQRVLIIRPGGIGDAVLLIPAIRALRAKHPAARITVLAESRNAGVFALCPRIDLLLRYDNPRELLRAVRGRYDAVIDTEQWHRLSAVVARFTRASTVIGFATNTRKKLFTHGIPYSHSDYEIDSFFRLLEPLSIDRPTAIHRPFLAIPDAALLSVGRLLGSVSGTPYTVLFTSASIPERRWGVDKFKELAEGLYARGIHVVVVGGRGDSPDVDRIVSGGEGINLAGKTSLAETAAIIGGAAVLVSGDSGILHIGVGLGKPTVSLFGPGISNKWAPRGDRHIVINKHLPCSPCTRFGYTPKCPIHAQCMADITVDEVVAAVEVLLNKKANP